MTERYLRIGAVVGGVSLAVFFLCGMAITEDNADVVAPIAVGALAAALLTALVVGLMWAWRGPDA